MRTMNGVVGEASISAWQMTYLRDVTEHVFVLRIANHFKIGAYILRFCATIRPALDRFVGMHKVLRRQPWICIRCLRAQRRTQSTVAAAVSPTTQDYAYTRNVDHQRDEETLRKIFDKKEVWQHFSHSAKTSAGLIGNRHLTSPRGFQKFADTSLAKCRKLVDKTLAASTIEEYRAIPKDLDRLSDLLCRVIDLSDFIRSIHPDQEYSAAATMSHGRMFQYMNELNTMTGLNEQLKKASSMPEVTSRWSEEECMAAEILMKDFAKSGIDLPATQREEFVNLSNDINQVGTEFVNQMEHAKDHVTLPKSDLQGIDPVLAKNINSWRSASIPVNSPVSGIIMATVHNDSARKQLYMAERTASRRTISRLEELFLRRARLAKLTGYSSFSQMTLADKMSKTPEAVNKFLRSLNDSNRGQLRGELDYFLNIKRKFEPNASTVHPWDHALLLNQAYSLQHKQQQRTSKSRLLDSLQDYFSIGNVMQGLSSLFNRLYAVRFVPQETRIGEVWHPDVRRLDVYTDSDERVATIYCDLFARPGKLPNPAHFTLVCSREIEESEAEEHESRREPLNDGMPVSFSVSPSTGKRAAYQLPIIALVCDFPANSSSRAPPSLSPHSLTTLFHEMGHAVHSVLGRTSMQGISGTRCATDFAELPSVLMEYFAMDPQVLSLFARHWKTDAPLPAEMVQAMIKDKQERAQLTGGWDNQTQILMALLDQAYHSEEPVHALSSGRYDSTSVYHHIWNKYGDMDEPAGTSQQGFFGHLHGYGATYYAYLFDRAIARQVWRAVFRDGADAGAIDRNSGERFKNEVLKWGGGRDPWKCLEGLMGEGKGVLAEGGELAMLEVGKWGVGAGAEGAM